MSCRHEFCYELVSKDSSRHARATWACDVSLCLERARAKCACTHVSLCIERAYARERVSVKAGIKQNGLTDRRAGGRTGWQASGDGRVNGRMDG